MIVISTPFNADLMLMFVQASYLDDKPDYVAVRQLCDRITGLKGYKTFKIAMQVTGIEGPRGYVDVRIFDKADMHEIASCFSAKNEPINVPLIAISVSMCNRSLAGQWVKTEPLYDHPHAAPGVLDLVAIFEPRPQQLSCYDLA